MREEHASASFFLIWSAVAPSLHNSPSTMHISVGAPDIDGVSNISTCARSELALALNAKDAVLLKILETSVLKKKRINRAT